MNAEVEEKTARLVDLLGREGLGGVVLNAQHNFAWLTGGASNGIDTSRDNGAASLLVTAAGKRYLLANNIEMPRMLAEQVSPIHFEPVEFTWQNEKINPATAVETARQIAGGRIATDISMAADARAIEPSIARCRYSLTADELERIRQLGRDSGVAMDHAVNETVPGSTEIQVAETMRRQFGSAGISLVVALVAADERMAAFRHPVPTAKPWRKTILMVACAKRHGLIVSLSRMVSAGPVSDDLMRRTEAAAFVNARLLGGTSLGSTGADLYRIAAEAYAEAGYADEIDNHHQGGAAGYRTREWVAHPENGETVQPDQAFAWNPSITGTKVEETVIVTAAGIEAISTSPGFPVVPIKSGGVTYNSPGILIL